jgi:type I restriction enzyme, S subunit
VSGRYPPYGAYTDSGISACPRRPVHWGVSRIKFLSVLNSPKAQVAALTADTPVTFLPMEAIGENGELDASRHRAIGDVRTGYTYLREGDVCIAKITPCFENGKGAIIKGTLNGIAFATTEVIPFRCHRAADAEFLYRVLTSVPFKADAEASMYGAGGQKRVADNFAGDYAILLPPPEERTQIAKFLDYETAKIDALIEKQQQLIALLKEKRQTVISHAVTKGLNPNAPMRDSGVEWLGKVPAHWTIPRIGYVASVFNGSTPSRDVPRYWVDEGIPWTASGQVNDDEIREPSAWISRQALAECGLVMAPEGSVVVGMIGQGKTRGSSSILRIKSTINQNMAAIVASRQIVPEFLYRVMTAAYDDLRLLGRGANQPALNCDILRAYRIPLPPRNEQQDITSHVEAILASTGLIIELAEAQQELLQERRTALISAAVTGKIDVRNWKPPQAAGAAQAS